MKNIFCAENRRLFIDIIVIAIPVMLIYFFLTHKPAEVKQTLQNNTVLEEKIDSVKVYNEFITEKIVQLEQNQESFYEIVAQNNNLIQQNNKELIKLKRIYNAKINNVNGFNVAQLDSFFTNRYKESYNR